MKKWIILLMISWLWLGTLHAQPKCHFEHYGLTDGLTQHSVMNILQDQKGFMWFATWDGLCKFDGYNFTGYKSSLNADVFMLNNRIDLIREDAYGYIWAKTYNGEFFRFDPREEGYVASFHLDEKAHSDTQILTMSSGKSWLTSLSEGALCITDTTNHVEQFRKENLRLPSNRVNTVYEDESGNSWILTDSGLTRVGPAMDDFTLFFSGEGGDEKVPFFSAYETKTEVWFGADRGRIYCYDKKTGLFSLSETHAGSDIIAIKKIYDNLLIILTSDDGFIIGDNHRTTLRKFDKSILEELPSDQMISCFIDSDGNIWLETDAPGVAKYNLVENRLKYYKSEDISRTQDPYGPHFFILEDKNRHVWIHPAGGGFFFYDKNTDDLLPFSNEARPNWRFSDRFHDIFSDRQGNLWLSTRSGGVEKIVFDNESFKLNDFYSAPFAGHEVRVAFQETGGNIWISDKETSSLQLFDEGKHFLGYLCEDGTISKTGTPIKMNAYAFFQDDKGNIWIGSKGNGLYLLETPTSGTAYRIRNYRHNPQDPYSLSHNAVYAIHQDKNKRMWIGTYDGGINLFDEKSQGFINSRNKLANYPFAIGNKVRAIQSCKQNVYVGTTLGLIAFPVDFDSPDSIRFKSYSRSNQEGGLHTSDIYNICITESDEIYIATFGGGMSQITEFDSEGYPARFKTYDSSNGLYSDIVLSILEDHNGALWLNSEGLLTKFDPRDESFEVYKEVSQLLNQDYFSEATPVLTRNNEIIYGYVKGTLSFYPDKIFKNEYIPYLSLIKFELSGDGSRIINIDDQSEIELTHNQNIFSIEFAALDFINPPSISYMYKLEGFDPDWIESNNQRTVNYTKLPPGKYIFKVKSTNGNGTWVDNERTLSIIVKPSFWQTPWAYAIYMILALSLLYIIFRSLFTYYRMRDKIKLEEQQIEMRTRFFTDISHEIRTPLTMIVSPVEDIIENEELSDRLKSQMQLILKNSNRMLNMVNQILDFRKIQKKNLQIKEVEFGSFVLDICNNFSKTAESKNIDLRVDNQIGNETLWIDSDGVEKLVFNLISNAIKYTTSDKKIEVSIYKKDKSIALQVKDEGRGMSKELQSKLFTRFSSFNPDKSNPSTGIGLSIVKEVADRHHAKIVVESNLNEGSNFIVLFQTGLEHLTKDENIEIVQTKPEEAVEASGMSELGMESEDSPIGDDATQSKLSILIVEDDADLRGFIRSILEPYYKLYEAENGQLGYVSAISNMPDFILSDIMMPEMDGIEFLRKIRENEETSHIPFILLSAKTNIDDKLEGITAGADDYITKPFHVKLLKAKIDGIMKRRRLFSTDLADSRDADLVTEEENILVKKGITSQDESFLTDVRQFIYENIDNSDLTIDDLVAQTKFSRRVFYNKMKSLTGMAPVEFVKDIRLKQAATLLQTQEYMVKEVAYMVGFTDVKYFTQCFKEVYQMTPSQYSKL